MEVVQSKEAGLPQLVLLLAASSMSVLGAVSIATAIGAYLFGRLARLGRRVLLPAELGLSGIGLVIVFATVSVPVVAVGAVLTGFATGLLLPTLLTWALEQLEFAQRGRGTGLWTGALFIGEFLFPLVIAAFAAATGGLQGGLAVLGVVAVVVAAVLWPTLGAHLRVPSAVPDTAA